MTFVLSYTRGTEADEALNLFWQDVDKPWKYTRLSIPQCAADLVYSPASAFRLPAWNALNAGFLRARRCSYTFTTLSSSMDISAHVINRETS